VERPDQVEGRVLGGDLAHPDPARLLEPAVFANAQRAGVAAPVALDAPVEGLRPETPPFEDAHVFHLSEPLVVQIIDVTDVDACVNALRVRPHAATSPGLVPGAGEPDDSDSVEVQGAPLGELYQVSLVATVRNHRQVTGAPLLQQAPRHHCDCVLAGGIEFLQLAGVGEKVRLQMALELTKAENTDDGSFLQQRGGLESGLFIALFVWFFQSFLHAVIETNGPTVMTPSKNSFMQLLIAASSKGDIQ